MKIQNNNQIMRKNIIIPPCSDFNRGDQALVWETKRFAEEVGFEGEYYFMAEAKEPVDQSVKHGLNPILPILEHPSKKFKSKDNISLNWNLLLKWGTVSFIDLLWSLLLLTRFRIVIVPFFTKSKKRSYKIFTESDSVFVKGGGFIHSYGGKTALYYIYFQLYHIFLAQSLGKDVYIFPNSLGPFDGWGVKLLVKRALKHAKIVIAREVRSAEMCRNILGLNIPVYPDFGFYLKNEPIESRELFITSNNIPEDRKLVAITARPHRFAKNANPQEAYKMFIQSMRKFAIWLYDNGYYPVFIEHVYAINNHENDSYCIQEIVKALPQDSYCYYVNRELNCCQLKQLYAYFDYIVGTRFHSMIFSMANMVPGIAITYVGNKGEGIMEYMNLEDYYICINDVTEETLIEKFTYLKETEEIAKKRIKDYLQKSNEKRAELISLIKK